jgi:hypothetical protein
MKPDERADFDPRIGLCSVCLHAKVVGHPRGGSAYYQCGYSKVDSGYEKFPAVPVRYCEAYSVS